MNRRIREIPAITKKPLKHVVIYARVSTNSMEQLASLKAQISGLTKRVSGHTDWKLVDIHIDISSSKKGVVRPAFNQMIEEAKAGLTDIVIVKNISRLGRDTVEVLEAINTLRESKVRIIFDQEELDTFTVGSSLLIATIEACTQAENESRSANIRWGIQKRAEDGKLGLFSRKCYGYDKNKAGELVINEVQATTVKLIFDLYLEGKSIVGIIKELKNREIKSPKGKDNWHKRAIEDMLSNEKYTGAGIVTVGGKDGTVYKIEDSHPPIISKETFETVQTVRITRSNIENTENGPKRKSSKYSSKK